MQGWAGGSLVSESLISLVAAFAFVPHGLVGGGGLFLQVAACIFRAWEVSGRHSCLKIRRLNTLTVTMLPQWVYRPPAGAGPTTPVGWSPQV